jgi:membrane protein
VTFAGLKRAFIATYQDVLRHHMLQVAAALSYYLVLSVFPGLIFLSAVMGSIPLPDLFGRVLGTMSMLLPPDTMRMVQSVLLDVLATNRKAWLSFGMLGAIWVASAAFAAIIEALNIAYDVQEERPFWKTRLLSVGLAAITAGLMLSALAVMIVGPRFGAWLAARIYLSGEFVLLWPAIHWSIAIVFTLVAVELVYFLAPNVKQRFGATLPGAILAVSCWLALSYLLGFYFRHLANLSRTYGTLAGFIAFMTWFYWNSFALLVGAELNAELAKESAKGQLPQKEQPGTENALPRAA